jgi:Na+/melibiose symporter-like transporter
MMADVADYSEWRTQRRATAIVFSAIVFGLKAGLGFGGAIGAYVLAGYGYVPNVAQSARALDGIRMSASLFPALGFLLCIVCLVFYRIDKRLETTMSEELTERRKKFTHTPVPVAP